VSEAANWHGTNGGYTNHRCRCADCTRAHAVEQMAYLRRNPRQYALLKARNWEYSYDRARR
jgi:hypothetical protein